MTLKCEQGHLYWQTQTERLASHLWGIVASFSILFCFGFQISPVSLNHIQQLQFKKKKAGMNTPYTSVSLTPVTAQFFLQQNNHMHLSSYICNFIHEFLSKCL